MCVQLPKRARWSSSQLRGRGGWTCVHRRLDHLDHRPQQLRPHDHGGGVDPICVDHFFINIGYGFDHAGYGSDHSSNVCDHADNASPLPCYKGRQIGDTYLLGLLSIDQVAWPTCSDHPSCRNNNHRTERRYDNRDHRYDNTSQSSRAR